MVTHWEEAGKPFLIQIVSSVLLYAGMYMGAPQGDCATLGDLLVLGNSRLPSVDGHQERPTLIGSQGAGAGSYTHLTLPTICRV